jgi:hypothetical protein
MGAVFASPDICKNMMFAAAASAVLKKVIRDYFFHGSFLFWLLALHHYLYPANMYYTLIEVANMSVRA